MGPLCHCEGQGLDQAAVSKCASPSGEALISCMACTAHEIECATHAQSTAHTFLRPQAGWVWEGTLLRHKALLALQVGR